MTIDTTVVNGRFVFPDGISEGALSIDEGFVLDLVEYDDVWRTIDASGHLVIPGLVQPGRLDSADVQEFVQSGVTTLLVQDDDHLIESPVDYLTTNLVAQVLNDEVSSPQRDRFVRAALAGDLLLEVEISELGQDSSQWIWYLLGNEDVPLHVVSRIDLAFPIIQFMFQIGHLRLGIPIPRIVAVLSTIPARWYGIDSKKGRLAPGSHGDLVVFDPEAVDPYRELPWSGRVICSLQRGNLLLFNGQIHTHPGDGLNLLLGAD